MNICIIYKFFLCEGHLIFLFRRSGVFSKIYSFLFSNLRKFPGDFFKYTPKKKSKVDIVKQG